MLEPHPRSPGEVLTKKYTFFPSPEASWSCGEHQSKEVQH